MSDRAPEHQTMEVFTVVIPCLNEEANIAEHVREVADAARALNLPLQMREIIVVDNGSTDATQSRARDAGARVVSEPRRGYGRACMSGAEAASSSDILVFMDGDRSDDPADLGSILAPLIATRADLVVGSRLGKSLESGALTTPQRLGNWIGCQALRYRHGVRVPDFGPFRAVRRNDLLSLNMQEMSYGWPLEMLMRAGKAGMTVESVDVHWRRRADGESKVSGNVRAVIATGYRYMRVLIRCW